MPFLLNRGNKYYTLSFSNMFFLFTVLVEEICMNNLQLFSAYKFSEYLYSFLFILEKIAKQIA